MKLDSRDSSRRRRLVLQIGEEQYETTSPGELSWREVVAVLDEEDPFRPPATWAHLACPGAQLTLGQAQLGRAAWIREHGLGTYEDAVQLCAYLERFWPQIELDLPPGLLASWWAERRWPDLLTLIGGLPRSGHFITALMDDDEYCEALRRTESARLKNIKGMVRLRDEQKGKPPFAATETTPTVEALMMLINEVRGMRYELVQVQVESKVRPPEPVAFPTFKASKVLAQAREAHNSSVHARVKSMFAPHLSGR